MSKAERRTPLVEALTGHLAKGRVSFHTPGHRGNALSSRATELLDWDLTELPDTGSLFDGGDAIEEAEGLAAEAFGAARTLFSAGGCTLCIQTMLFLGAGAGGRVLMARNAHRSAVHAAALLGIEVVWCWPEDLSRPVSPNEVSEKLKTDKNIRAVYITSPDYYGNLADVEGIAAVCADEGVPLLVDNAHGSHLGAFGLHPLALGAAMTADSAHKTLPVLTGGGYLHLGKEAAARYSSAAAKGAMALFGSTSPAYPVMASLDLCQDWWRREGKVAYRRTAEALQELVGEAEKAPGLRPGFLGARRDPCRLTLEAENGSEAADWFREQGCEPELADQKYLVFILTPFDKPEGYRRLGRAIREYRPGGKSQKTAFSAMPLELRPRTVFSLREALLRPAEEVPIEQATGRIAARTVCPCPPGVGVLLPGEEIDPAMQAWLLARGIKTVSVVR